MKTIVIFSALFTFSAIAFAQTHITPGNVSGTWTISGSPYLIEGEISIPSSQTLTIEPGVMVEFQGHYTLFVQGRLVAIGTETDNITFTINDTTGFYDPETTLGGWYGIRFVNTPIQNDTSKIIYCKLQYGKALGSDWYMNAGGAVCIIEFDKVIISNSTFSSCSATRSGGGIFVWQSDLSIDNCKFNNTLTTNYGGAIRCDSSSITITNSDFTQNHALWGGGIFNVGSEFYLNDCLFTENFADHGGAVYSTSGSFEFTNVTFEQNSSGWGGGIGALNTNLKIDSCLFFQNNASNNSGAIDYDIDIPGATTLYYVDILNSKFIANTAVSYYGAVKIMQINPNTSVVDVNIDRCEFLNNTATQRAAIRIDGNIYDFVISNSVFSRNSANTQSACSFVNGPIGKVFNCLFNSNTSGIGLGPAFLYINSSVDFINCTFANNSGGAAGGLHLRQKSNAKVINSIFWGNHPDQISLQAGSDTSACTIYLNYNDVQLGADSIHRNDTVSVISWGIGNIDSYPLFEDTLAGDYHPQDQSPCIAAGIDSIEMAGFWYYCPSTDIEGNPRPNPAGSMPDMGAYESQYPVRVEEEFLSLPSDYALFQNYPNPFNPSTAISYQLPEASNVTLKIFNALGEEVTTLINNEYKNAGEHSTLFIVNSSLPSGVYFYQLNSGTFVQTRKMLLLK